MSSVLYNKKELLNGQFGATFCPRTKQSIDNDLIALKNGTTTSAICGIIAEPVLHKLPNFHFTINNSLDPMHDILEGIVSLTLKKILDFAINDCKSITDIEFNRRVQEFDYGMAENRDKPSANFNARALRRKGSGLSQSASQIWLLLRCTPFLIADVLNQNRSFAAIITDLLHITFFSFSNILDEDKIARLNIAIESFHNNYKVCFPKARPINKVHHVAHYPGLIRKNGPISRMSCLQFEGKFKQTKAVTKTCGNFINLTHTLTKRLNLKQVDCIIKRTYTTDVIVVLSCSKILKVNIQFALLLYDLPDELTNVNHLSINGTSFKPGLVSKYQSCGVQSYGIIKCIVETGTIYYCIIEVLEIIEFCHRLNCIKTRITSNLIRVTLDKVYTRKTYSLWRFTPSDDFFYISLKYVD